VLVEHLQQALVAVVEAGEELEEEEEELAPEERH
jgi:hypothetical protein